MTTRRLAVVVLVVIVVALRLDHRQCAKFTKGGKV
jgi:hypothetical protein